MLPAFAPGDRVVGIPARLPFVRPHAGSVVVLRAPDGSGRLEIKRIAAGPGGRVEIDGREAVLGPDEWFVTGDNAEESTDSRHFGPIRSRDIVAIVWFRY